MTYNVKKYTRTAWITGGSTGIGAETAKILAKDGWKVAVTARSVDDLKALAKEHPNIEAFPGDVTQPEKMEELISLIESSLGEIKMAVLNAGTYKADTLENFNIDTFKKHFDINVFGVANCVAPLLRRFKKRNEGHIAITASVAGYHGLPRSLSYGPTKAALINFAESLYIEAKNTKIKVQVICPGFVKTPLTAQNDFDMPMVMEAKDAAEKLVRGLYSNRFEITFPWFFCFVARRLAALPQKLSLAIFSSFKKDD